MAAPSSPTVSDEVLRQRILDSITAEEAASEIMHEVATKATDMMISNHFDRLSVPYTVRCVTKEMLDFINCAFVGQDNGFVRSDGWHADPSADNILIDTWARSAVATRPVQKKEPITITPPQSTEPTAPKRLRNPLGTSSKDAKPGGKLSDRFKKVSSLAVSDGGASGSARNSSRTPNSDGGLKRTASRRQGSTTDTVAGEDASAAAANAQDDSNLSPEEAEYVNRVRAEQKKKEEQRQLSEKLGKQMDDMKNIKDFTVDGRTGRVLPIKSANEGRAAHLKKMEMKFNVGGDYSGGAEGSGLNGSVGGGGGDGSSSSPSVPKQPKSAPASMTGGKKGVDASRKGPGYKAKKTMSEFYQEEQTYGPMVDAVLPSGGVAVKDGDSAKRAELRLPKSKVSRHEFKKMVDTIPQDIEDETSDFAKTSPTVPTKSAGGGSLPIRQDAPPPNPAVRAQNVRQTTDPISNNQQTATRTGEYRSQKTAVLPSQRSLGTIPPIQHTVPVPTKKNTAVPPLDRQKKPKQKVMVHQALLDDPLGDDDA